MKSQVSVLTVLLHSTVACSDRFRPVLEVSISQVSTPLSVHVVLRPIGSDFLNRSISHGVDSAARFHPTSAFFNASKFELTEPDQSKQDAKGCLGGAESLGAESWESWDDGFSAANSCSVSPAMDVR